MIWEVAAGLILGMAPPPALLEYYREVTSRPEYGISGGPRRWHSIVQVGVEGTFNQEDIQELSRVLLELRSLTHLDIRWASPGQANFTISFLSRSAMISRNPLARDNYGLFTVWPSRGAIERAEVMISIEGLSRKERDHLIREEVTQAFGPLNDSYRYPDSIFYQAWTDITEYSPIDREVIRYLYR